MRIGNCPRCNAPQGMIGWLCGHTGNKENDGKRDLFWENWAKRMKLHPKLQNK
jgi:hypothetical protein